LRQSTTFKPRLKILQDKFHQQKNTIVSIHDKTGEIKAASISQLSSCKELITFLANNLGQLVQKPHQDAVLAGEESELVLKAAIEQRGLNKKTNHFLAGIVVSLTLALGGIVTKIDNLVLAGLVGVTATSAALVRTSELDKVAKNTLETAKKIKV
jgi:hypothetical protein